MNVITLTADGGVFSTPLPYPTMPFLQAMVASPSQDRGLLDVVRVTDDVDMWVNDEAQSVDCVVNEAASFLAGRTIWGDVVLAGHDEEGAVTVLSVGKHGAVMALLLGVAA